MKKSVFHTRFPFARRAAFVALLCGLAGLLGTGCSSTSNSRPPEADGFYNPAGETDFPEKRNWKPHRNRKDFFLPPSQAGS